MKKIGIITYFYNSTNYGGILQAYALCRYLNSRGLLAEQICYDYDSFQNQKRNQKVHLFVTLKKCVKSIFKLFLNPKKIRRLVVKDRGLIEKKKNFRNFINKYIPHSEEIYTCDTIQNSKDNYNIFICGSDQIWNPISMDSNFFLSFVPDNIKKIAYAASLGADRMSENNNSLFKKYIQRIDFISLREHSGKEYLNKIGIHNVMAVPDPVFLLDEKEWSALSDFSAPNTDYIVTYFLCGDEKIRAVTMKFADKNKLKIIDLSPLFLYSSKKAMSCSEIEPGGFLSMIQNANYVFTDSFHCTAYSVLFMKKFITFKRKDIKNITANTRISDLLCFFKLEYRFVDKDCELNRIIEERIDRKQQEERLQQFSNIGKRFLENAILS